MSRDGVFEASLNEREFAGQSGGGSRLVDTALVVRDRLDQERHNEHIQEQVGSATNAEGVGEHAQESGPDDRDDSGDHSKNHQNATDGLVAGAWGGTNEVDRRQDEANDEKDLNPNGHELVHNQVEQNVDRVEQGLALRF